jgi:hypothetical protein
MRNTPITDDLARQFAGKRLSSREAGSVWSLCRDLERELNKVITALAQSKEANAGLMRACENLESEIADAKETIEMLEIRHGSTMLCHEAQLREVTKQRDELAALAATKGGSDE